MQKFLDLVWWLRVGSFFSAVCLCVFGLAAAVSSRRRSDRRRTKTGISACPPVYTACPKTFDFFWISRSLAFLAFATVCFTIGLVFSSNGDPTDGDRSGNVAVALQVYRSLSEVSQRRRRARLFLANGSSRPTGFAFGRNHGRGRCGCTLPQPSSSSRGSLGPSSSLQIATARL
jgi:hypothetical protein